MTEKNFWSSGYFGNLFSIIFANCKTPSSFLISAAKQEISGNHAVILFSFKAPARSTFPQALPGWITSLSEHPTSGRGEKPADIFLITSGRIFAVFNAVHGGDSLDLEEDGHR